ncbi:polyprenyl synthetase family protein [bacterium]|nr:polyprenyl synthetase family protein [bacterium]
MKYSLFAGGKRLRPVLLMTTVECGGKDPVISLPIACAIEYIHTYSLIHDDLPCMDNDDLRRGNPTNHIKFGEAIALLAGDSLLTHSFALIGSIDNDSIPPVKLIKIINLLAEKAGIYGMVSGQVADIDNLNADNPAQKLKFIHSHKTGALITASIQIGAILADFSEENYNLLTKFGEEIGKCFQIQDDILDETGDRTRLGKTPGSDTRNNTLTYPKIYGLEKSVSLANESFKQALEYLGKINRDLSRLHQLAEFVLKRDH